MYTLGGWNDPARKAAPPPDLDPETWAPCPASRSIQRHIITYVVYRRSTAVYSTPGPQEEQGGAGDLFCLILMVPMTIRMEYQLVRTQKSPVYQETVS